jgi:hypothetical protein
MKSTGLLFLAFAVIVGLLFYLSFSAKKPPAVPQDAIHEALLSDSACPACHGAGKELPMKTTHPPKEQCLTCHKRGRV